MQRPTSAKQPRDSDSIAPIDGSLRIALWLAWVLAVSVTGFLTWHAAHLTHHPVSLLALLIHCLLAACIGMVAITWIELRIARGVRQA